MVITEQRRYVARQIGWRMMQIDEERQRQGSLFETKGLQNLVPDGVVVFMYSARTVLTSASPFGTDEKDCRI
jgi:hypothetical protein